MKMKTLLKNLNPLNNRQNMPTALYVIKKVLAFLLIYGLAAVLGEALIIGGLMVMGYNPLSGVMPAGHVAELLKYYGFGLFFLVAVLYCKVIEKRSLKSMGFRKSGFDYFLGGALAVLLLAIVVGIGCATGTLGFVGVSSSSGIPYLIALFGGFCIQSLAEETLCRGFLFTSLSKKVHLPLAMLVSSCAFALGHLPTVLEAQTPFAIIGVLNLFLVSAVFTLLFQLRANIYIVSGLHGLWNFVLNGVMGLSVSGSDGNTDALLHFQVNRENLLTGGIYGLEASIVTTAVLGITALSLFVIIRKKEN